MALGKSEIYQILVDLQIKNRAEAKRVVKDLNKELDKANVNTAKWTKQDKQNLAQLNKIKGALNQSNKEITQMSTKTKTFGQHFSTAFKRAFSLEKVLNRMAFVITAQISYELFNIATRSLKSIVTNTIEWEKEMSKVYSLLEDSEKIFKSLMDENVLKLMTQYGQTLEQSVRAVYDTLSARFDPQDVGIITENAAKLAVAEFTDIKTATDILTTTLNSFNLTAADSDIIIGKLSQTVTDAKTTLSAIAPNFGKISSAANALNLSLEDTLALFSLMTVKGLKADVTITAIRQLMFTLAAPTQKAKDAMDEYGVSLDLARIQSEGFKVVLDELRGADEEFLLTLAKSRRGAQALLPLIASETEFMELLENQTTSSDEALRKYNERADDAELAIDKMKGSFFELSISLREDVNPTVTAFAEIVTIMNQEITKFNRTEPGKGIRDITSALAALAALTGGVGLVKYLLGTGAGIGIIKSIGTEFAKWGTALKFITSKASLALFFLLKSEEAGSAFAEEQVKSAQAQYALDLRNENTKKRLLGLQKKTNDENKFVTISNAKEELKIADDLFAKQKERYEIEKALGGDVNMLILGRIAQYETLIGVQQELANLYEEDSDAREAAELRILKLTLGILNLRKEMLFVGPPERDYKPVEFISEASFETFSKIKSEIFKMASNEGIGRLTEYVTAWYDIGKLSKEQYIALLNVINGIIDAANKAPDPSGWELYGDKVVAVFSNIADAAQSIFQMMSDGIQSRLDDDLEKLNDREKAEIDYAESVGMETENIQNKYDNLRKQREDKARNDAEDARKKMLPIMVAESTANTILAVQQVLSDETITSTFLKMALATSIGLAGAARTAQLAGLQFAEGGFVSGPGSGTSDSIPARLSDGEYVVNAKSTGMYLPLLEAINGMQPITMPAIVPSKFATGGMVNAGGSAESLELISAMMDKLDNMEFKLSVSGRQAGTLTNAGQKHLAITSPK